MPGQQHVRCVVLVIAHRSPSYAPFREVWDAHWRRATTNGSDRLRFYLYNDPAVGAPPDSLNEELTFPYEETYPAPGLLLKTLAAIDLLAAAGVTYDFLLRTNLSSLFDWPAFDAYLDAAPRPPRVVRGGRRVLAAPSVGRVCAVVARPGGGPGGKPDEARPQRARR